MQLLMQLLQPCCPANRTVSLRVLCRNSTAVLGNCCGQVHPLDAGSQSKQVCPGRALSSSASVMWLPPWQVAMVISCRSTAAVLWLPWRDAVVLRSRSATCCAVFALAGCYAVGGLSCCCCCCAVVSPASDRIKLQAHVVCPATHLPAPHPLVSKPHYSSVGDRGALLRASKHTAHLRPTHTCRTHNTTAKQPHDRLEGSVRFVLVPCGKCLAVACAAAACCCQAVGLRLAREVNQVHSCYQLIFVGR